MLHGVKNCVQHCSRIKSSAWREIEGNLWGLRKKLLAGLVVRFHEEKKKEICAALINIYPVIHPCSLRRSTV